MLALKHKNGLRSQPLCFFCISCNLAVCRDCTVAEHCPPVHQIEPIDNVAEKQIKSMESLMNEARAVSYCLNDVWNLTFIPFYFHLSYVLSNEHSIDNRWISTVQFLICIFVLIFLFSQPYFWPLRIEIMHLNEKLHPLLFKEQIST